ncbi:hypothetical protein [Providencia stuartii]|uniref:hypothetical protein n=1 Tax=Providencia stuartii TaxID=588 RepID=UPI0023AE7F75|nr:hypothetical protein [Providencia thailandensis]MDE8747563.1 hypothetical protein [Providencia thailandensis]MDE8766569.1 hypothetical protein [Providencia thailandensis]MDE8778616.1 hypothetical protein [Providencia thailandensis]MDE8783034.1 hypothetical protein [Providencia thailandensis]MDE8787028.1 hypothetical protein [Providencia thailandensis]
MNNTAYNAMTICKMNNAPPPKYIDEFWQHHGKWECKIYKLIDGDYQLVSSFFEYENASDEAKEIMNQLPKMKERIFAFLNLR